MAPILAPVRFPAEAGGGGGAGGEREGRGRSAGHGGRSVRDGGKKSRRPGRRRRSSAPGGGEGRGAERSAERPRGRPEAEQPAEMEGAAAGLGTEQEGAGPRLGRGRGMLAPRPSRPGRAEERRWPGAPRELRSHPQPRWPPLRDCDSTRDSDSHHPDRAGWLRARSRAGPAGGGRAPGHGRPAEDAPGAAGGSPRPPPLLGPRALVLAEEASRAGRDCDC